MHGWNILCVFFILVIRPTFKMHCFNTISSLILDNDSCRVVKKKVVDLKIGGCISENPIEIGKKMNAFDYTNVIAC